MSKITRKTLENIIKEEVSAALTNEGFLDDLSVIGKDISQYMRTVRSQGAEKALKRSEEKVKREQIAALNRQKSTLEKELRRSDNPQVAEKIAQIKTAITAIRQGGAAGDVVAQELAAGADPETPRPEVSPGRAEVERVLGRAAASTEKKDKETGGTSTPAKKAAGVDAKKWNFKTNPEGIVDIIIKSIAELNLNSSSAITKDGIGGINDKQKAALLNRIGINSVKASGEARVAAARGEAGQLEEGLLQSIKIPRSTLREILHIIQEKWTINS